MKIWLSLLKYLKHASVERLERYQVRTVKVLLFLSRVSWYPRAHACLEMEGCQVRSAQPGLHPSNEYLLFTFASCVDAGAIGFFISTTNENRQSSGNGRSSASAALIRNKNAFN